MKNDSTAKRVQAEELTYDLWSSAGQVLRDAQGPRRDSIRIIEEMAEELERKNQIMDVLGQLEHAARLYSELLEQADDEELRARYRKRRDCFIEDWFRWQAALNEHEDHQPLNIAPRKND